MFIIIYKKTLKKTAAVALAIVILICSGIFVIKYVETSRLTNKYEALVDASSLVDSTNLIYQLALEEEKEREYKNIEVFDVTKGKVIKKIKSNSTFQKEAETYLQGITGMYVKVQAFPVEGYIVRIPFEPNIAVQNKWLRDYGINTLNETFVIFPTNEKPYLLVLDQNKRPIFYNFEGDTNTLLESLKLGT